MNGSGTKWIQRNTISSTIFENIPARISSISFQVPIIPIFDSI